MYKVQVKSRVTNIHAIFLRKLLNYGFIKVAESTYELKTPVEELGAVMFYKKNLEIGDSPFKVRAIALEGVEAAKYV